MLERPKNIEEPLYSVDGSKPEEWKVIYRWALARGYSGGGGPFHLAEWLRLRGKEMYEIRGVKRYIIQ